MKELARDFYARLARLISTIKAGDRDGTPQDFYQSLDQVARMLLRLPSDNKAMFIGNGANASICSHMAIDFWKNTGIRALAFNDSAQLTTLGNDFGYEHVFGKPIEMFAQPGDLLFALSSSGKSPNILLGVEAARRRECAVVTLSGFGEDNPLRALGDVNFYVAAPSYALVEVVHHSICHGLLDIVMTSRSSAGEVCGA